MLENRYGFIKSLSNFRNYQQKLNDFAENMSRIAILCPEITTSNLRIESRKETPEIPGRTSHPSRLLESHT